MERQINRTYRVVYEGEPIAEKNYEKCVTKRISLCWYYDIYKHKSNNSCIVCEVAGGDERWFEYDDIIAFYNKLSEMSPCMEMFFYGRDTQNRITYRRVMRADWVTGAWK